MLIFIYLALVIFLCNAQSVPPSGCTLKSPLPTGKRCGVPGYAPLFGHKNYFQTLPSLADCENFVLRRQSRSYLRYNYDTGLCFYTANPLRNFTMDPSSNKVFYDTDCFDCPAACPQNVGENLFDNSGFELSAYYLAPWHPGHGIPSRKTVTGGAYGSSSKAYQCKRGCSLGQNFQYCPGVIYQWGYDYKSTNSPKKGAYLEPAFDADVYTFLTILEDDVWRTYNDLKYHTAGSGEFSMLAPSIAKNQTVEFDNFRLIPTSYTLDTKPDAVNVLANGGFENGSADPWILDIEDGHSLSIVSPGIDSNHAVQFTYNRDNVVPGFSLQQDLRTAKTQIIADTPYLLSFDYVSNNPSLIIDVISSIRPAEDIDYSAKKPFVVQENQQSQTSMNGTIQLVFLGQANASYLYLEIYTFGGTLGKVDSMVLIDNISIRELAPPG